MSVCSSTCLCILMRPVLINFWQTKSSRGLPQRTQKMNIKNTFFGGKVCFCESNKLVEKHLEIFYYIFGVLPNWNRREIQRKFPFSRHTQSLFVPFDVQEEYAVVYGFLMRKPISFTKWHLLMLRKPFPSPETVN